MLGADLLSDSSLLRASQSVPPVSLHNLPGSVSPGPPVTVFLWSVHLLSRLSRQYPGTSFQKYALAPALAEGHGSWELGGRRCVRVSWWLPGMENFTQTPGGVGRNPLQTLRLMHGDGRLDIWSPSVLLVTSDGPSRGEGLLPVVRADLYAEPENILPKAALPPFPGRFVW